MGVRGLTTYIAKYADRYLNPLELHDCNLVIDGDSLSCYLYKSTNSAFGGDYDHYFRVICGFFGMLKQCNIVAYVLLDGGYQPKKLTTVKQRLRSKVGAIKHLNPYDCQATFPILMRDVFVEAMESSGIHYMRCVFEADDEVAALARKLRCQVLSFDSDFFIHNVPYIPLATLERKVFRRNVTATTAPNDGSKKHRVRQRQKLVTEFGVNDEFCTKTVSPPSNQSNANNTTSSSIKSYHYMKCSVYQIANLAREENLRDEMLPLFAILLGNDYIHRSIFKKFFLNVSMKNTGKKSTQQGKRIVALLRWLKNETLATAIEKIVNHVEKEKKHWLRQQIDIGIAGYVHEKSLAFEFFQSDNDCSRTMMVQATNESEINVQADVDEAIMDEELEPCSEDEEDADGSERDSDDESAHDTCDSGDNQEQTEDGENNQSQQSDDDDGSNSNEHFNKFNVLTYHPPEWLLQKILDAKLPRYIVDLMTLRLYINAPQVENFLLPDCNRISVPILRLIFTYLHYPKHREFRYLTRIQRRTDIEYLRYDTLDIHAMDSSLTNFRPADSENFAFFKLILNDFDDSEAIFQAIDSNVPAELRLFVLAMIFWSRTSTHFNVVYASSLLLCHLTLTSIDSKLEQIVRDRLQFDKLFNATTLKKISAANRATKIHAAENVADDDRDGPKKLSIESCRANVTRDECISAQSNLVELFSLNEKIRTKHTEFSSDIIHGFAEFQAIVHQINCLNVLCGEHYQCIDISKSISGCFLYNLYVTLKDRPNINYYIQKFIFTNSPNLFATFQSMIEMLQPFIDCLATESISKRKKRRNLIKKRSREQKKNAQRNEEVVTTAEVVHGTNGDQSSGSEFEDLNNKFSCLLKM